MFTPSSGGQNEVLYISNLFILCFCLSIFFQAIDLFLNFWLCWVFTATCGSSLVVASRSCSLIVEYRLFLVAGSFCEGAWALGCVGFSSYSSWAPEHKVSSSGIWA